MLPAESQPSIRKRKPREEKRPSCNGCRAQKLRCDAYLHDFQGCSRCRKQKLECIVPSQHKKMRSLEGSSKDESEAAPNSPSALSKTLTAESSYTPHSSYETPVNSSLRQGSTVPPDFSNDNLTNRVTLVPDSSTELPTSSRTLDGFLVNGNIIDTCFQQFFQHCSPLVPILSKQLSPDKTFVESQLKFWVIVLIGSRRCLEGPILLQRLTASVINLAFMSLSTCAGSPNIEALLILCTWHFGEKRPLYLSKCFIIVGSLLHAALQAGFQNCLHMQNNTSGRDHMDDASEAGRRAHLWEQVVITYQSVMGHSGNLIYNQHPAYPVCDKRPACQYRNGIALVWSKASALSARVHLAMSDIISHEEGSAQDDGIKSLIRASEAQLAVIKCGPGEQSSDTIMSKLHVATALLQIRTFYLFCSPNAYDSLEVSQLYNAANSVLDEAAKLDALYAPKFVYQAATLAACIIIKLLKGPKAEFLDENPGTSALFSAINICKRMSVENNDAPAKTATIFSQLWLSERLYKDPDGQSKWPLQVRSRLSASVIFDTLWWRQELLKRAQRDSPSRINQPEARLQTEPLHNGETNSFTDDSWLLDVDWLSQF